MNATLLVGLLSLVPALLLFAGSAILLRSQKTIWSLLQLIGAGCLLLVVVVHIFEALHLFPWMGWGLEHSVGHYLDLTSALLGLTLFPVGFLLHAHERRRR